MSNEAIKDKLRKLIAHEQSARAIGNVAEADAYARHVKTLLRRHGLTKKSLSQPEREQPVTGAWLCSCGFTLKLHIDAGGGNRSLLNALLFPHEGPGHKLTIPKGETAA